jgi:hypothetical protein
MTLILESNKLYLVTSAFPSQNLSFIRKFCWEKIIILPNVITIFSEGRGSIHKLRVALLSEHYFVYNFPWHPPPPSNSTQESRRHLLNLRHFDQPHVNRYYFRSFMNDSKTTFSVIYKQQHWDRFASFQLRLQVALAQ